MFKWLNQSHRTKKLPQDSGNANVCVSDFSSMPLPSLPIVQDAYVSIPSVEVPLNFILEKELPITKEIKFSNPSLDVPLQIVLDDTCRISDFIEYVDDIAAQDRVCKFIDVFDVQNMNNVGYPTNVIKTNQDRVGKSAARDIEDMIDDVIVVVYDDITCVKVDVIDVIDGRLWMFHDGG